jgi:hypothetical protein
MSVFEHSGGRSFGETSIDPARDDLLWRKRLVTIIALVLLAWAGYRAVVLIQEAWPFTTDDAFISMRYARNWADGHGITWNPGEPPVEGYSNFLFVALGALLHRLGVASPIGVIKVLCAVSLLATCGLLYLLARRWLGPLGSVIPVLCLLAFPGTVMWTVSGLETAVYQLLFVAGIFLGITAYRQEVGLGPASAPSESFGRPPSRWALVGGGLCALLAALARPEGPVLLLLLVALVGIVEIQRMRSLPAGQRSTWRRETVVSLSCLILPFALVYVPYFWWRVVYFGRLLPNPVYCKANYAGDPWNLNRDFLTAFWPYILLALIPLIKRRTPRYLLLLAAPAVYCLILYGADPVIGHLNRHFLAALAPLLVAAAIGFVQIVDLLLPRGRSWAADGLAAGFVVAITFLPLIQLETWFHVIAGKYADRNEVRTELALELRSRLESEDWFVIGDAGVIPYVAGGKSFDVFCLNSREFTGPEIDYSAEAFTEMIFEREPRFFVFHSRRPDRLVPVGEVFNALAAHEDFETEYSQQKVYDVPRDFYWFFVYERAQDPAPPERLGEMIASLGSK